MAINVRLQDELGGIIADGGIVELRELPAFDDQRYPYLRLIDPYENTIFSSYQVQWAVLHELERFAVESPSPHLDRVLQLARDCGSEVHTYLWFIGD